MNTFDIIITVILVITAAAGYRQGIIIQLCGLAGIILGIWLALRFSAVTAVWLDMDGRYAALLAFVLIIAVTVTVLYFVGLLFRKVFRMTGFGFLDRFGGLVLSVFKYALVISLLTGFLLEFNRGDKLFKQSAITDGVIYRPLNKLSRAAFPGIARIIDGVFD